MRRTVAFDGASAKGGLRPLVGLAWVDFSTGEFTAASIDERRSSSSRNTSRAAQAAPPDLIMLEINMPEMGGYEVCEQLKADDRTAAIPVIFISALGETLDKVRAFEVGGVDFVTKPFQVEEVLARIKTHLQIRALQIGSTQIAAA